MAGASSFGGADHTVVIGGGPVGLSAADALSRLQVPVTVVEKEEEVGGLGRTLEFMGCRFDVGPRPLVVRDESVDGVLTSLLGREVRSVSRLARGFYRGRFFNRPLQMSEVLVKLGPVEAARCLGSYARARLRPIERPVSLGDRVSNRLGRRITEIFVEGHLWKVWGDLADEFIGRSGEFGLSGALGSSTPESGLPAAVGSFRYPRGGAGQIWQTLAARIELAGGRIRLGEEVVAVRHGMGRVLSVVVRDRFGFMMDVVGAEFVSTMAIQELVGRLRPAAPATVRAAAEALRYRDLITVNVVVDRESVFPDQWIDVVDPAVRVARITNFRNFSRAMVPDSGLSGLGMEYFCDAGDGVWQMSDLELLDLARRELVALGLCRAEEVKAGMVRRWPKACLVPDDRLLEAADVVREWARRALGNLWLVEEPDEADAVSDQAAGIGSGLAVAEGIGRRRSRRALDILNRPFRSSSTVEQRAVNATVPGSNPGSGATPSS